ncbi:hypothetical protein [Silvimonas sp.]|uniref:hypothetical protein n=1 Tax=Silvimonas sp. TaxID=2650811 RepID=UPI00283C6614|nr:hypothetical protein [Silvimonas sp.]MDR3430277.1 hypothetical protein [Silvimonas sp.]
MARNEGIIGTLLRKSPLGKAWPRRAVAAGLIAVSAVCAVYPQPYRAAMTLTPADPPTLSPVAMGGGFNALTGMLGNQAQVEVLVRVAQSTAVAQAVSAKLDLPHRLGWSERKVEVWLGHKVEVHSLRGGMVMFDAKLYDPVLARDIISAYGDCVRERTAVIGRSQTAYKRDALLNLLHRSGDQLSAAQSAYDSFRLQTRYSSPQTAISAIGDRIPELEAMIRGKEVELNATRQFGTDDNMRVRQVIAEIDALKVQLAQVRSVTPGEQGSVGRVVHESTELDRLRRNLDLARTVYDNYVRYLQSTTAEDIAAISNARILEPPYIDPERQYNFWAVLAGGLIVLLEVAMEFYLVRPPIGSGKAEGQDGVQ